MITYAYCFALEPSYNLGPVREGQSERERLSSMLEILGSARKNAELTFSFVHLFIFSGGVGLVPWCVSRD